MKTGLAYYRAYPRDFFEGTMGMPFEVKGAYRLVLDLIYLHGGNLPADDRYIGGMLGMSMRKWRAVRDDLVSRGKLKRDREIISNFRADFEIESTRSYLEKKRENGSAPKLIKGLPKPPVKRNGSLPEPESNKREVREEGGGGSARDPHEEILLAAGVDPSKDVSGKWFNSTQQSTVQRWRDAGFSQAEIVAEIRGIMAGRAPPGSLAYFNRMFERALAARLAPPLQPAPIEETRSARPSSPTRAEQETDAWLAGASRGPRRTG